MLGLDASILYKFELIKIKQKRREIHKNDVFGLFCVDYCRSKWEIAYTKRPNNKHFQTWRMCRLVLTSLYKNGLLWAVSVVSKQKSRCGSSGFLNVV